MITREHLQELRAELFGPVLVAALAAFLIVGSSIWIPWIMAIKEWLQ